MEHPVYSFTMMQILAYSDLILKNVHLSQKCPHLLSKVVNNKNNYLASYFEWSKNKERKFQKIVTVIIKAL